MLARAVKPNCDGLHNMAKQILIWAFHGKRKLNSQNNKRSQRSRSFYDNDFLAAKRPRNSFNVRDKFSELNDLQEIKWDEVTLKPFTKNFYKPHPNILSRPREEITAFLKENKITIRGENCPDPVFTFEETGLPRNVINFIREELNFSQPTTIQSMGWPIALSGHNMVALARTGSGKTLGFILPAIIHIQHQPELDRNDGPIALVLGPTRELVQQTAQVARKLAHMFNIETAAVFGGSGRAQQTNQLRNRPEICVATPGRLLDFLRAGVTNLRRCTYLVLDEADMMFDMGFEPQIRSILGQIRPDRQVLMWSATWPQEIRSLAEEYLNDFIQVNVGSLELQANPNIEQIIHVCESWEKNNMLTKILKEILADKENKTLIFAATKKQVDYLAFSLKSQHYRAHGLHGGKTQAERESILRSFRNGDVPILVATDVAARGLDVSDVKYVINYDYPNSAEDYVHRIGRTARHNASGIAHSFLTEKDASKVNALIKVLRDANQKVSPELESLAKSVSSSSKFYKSYRHGGNFQYRTHRRF